MLFRHNSDSYCPSQERPSMPNRQLAEVQLTQLKKKFTIDKYKEDNIKCFSIHGQTLLCRVTSVKVTEKDTQSAQEEHRLWCGYWPLTPSKVKGSCKKCVLKAPDGTAYCPSIWEEIWKSWRNCRYGREVVKKGTAPFGSREHHSIWTMFWPQNDQQGQKFTVPLSRGKAHVSPSIVTHNNPRCETTAGFTFPPFKPHGHDIQRNNNSKWTALIQLVHIRSCGKANYNL